MHEHSIKVDTNRFILTLDTRMPTDYACAALEEGFLLLDQT